MIKSMDVFDDTIEESIADYSEYEELLPMVKLVARMKREIKDYIASLSAEKNTIGLITANMTEGMILIDRNDDIISINRSACDLVNPVFLRKADETSLNSAETPISWSLLSSQSALPALQAHFPPRDVSSGRSSAA